MKIVALNHHSKSITGGHVYNDKLYKYLSEISNRQILYEPDLKGKYNGWKKLIGPIVELKRLKDISHGDIVFFTDTAFKYHLLLLLFCRLFKKSYNACIVHHFTFLEYTGFKRFVLEHIVYLYCKLSSVVIVPSPYTKALAEKKMNNVFYIPLPLDNEYCPSTTYNEGELLFVGAIEKRKGLNYLLKALKILKDRNVDFKLNIVGAVKEENTFAELKTMIEEYSLNSQVSFKGRVSNEELVKFYKSSELFVFPSLLEGYGMVFVEAMRYGLPIICFDNSAMPYSIKNGVNGFLAKNMDAEDLAVNIAKVLHNRFERARLQDSIGNILNEVKTEKDFYNAIDSFYNTLNK